MAKDDLENLYNVLAGEAEEGVTCNNLRTIYRVISRMRVGKNNAPNVPSPNPAAHCAHQSMRH